MSRVLTKKKVLIFCALGLLFAICWAYLGTREACYINVSCRTFFDRLQFIGEILGSAMFILPFSLITYFLHDRVFKAWIWFAVVWVPILIIVPNFFDSHNGNFGLSDAAGALFLLIVGYVFFSLLIILVQSARVYWLKRS